MARLENSFAILIGVGNDLPVTAGDALAIHEILVDEHYAGYARENTFLLTEEKATRTNILSAFDKVIERADEMSSIFLFYSGHGGFYEPWNQFYLVPYNFDPVNYENTWIKAEELRNKISQIRSKRLAFFLDCCHAAGIGQQFHIKDRINPIQSLNAPEGLAQEIDDGRGMSIISSCREDQQSFIMDGDVNSLYTKCLKEVLKASHKEKFDEPFVRISEVVQYIFKKVPERNSNQKPYANLQIYDDFALSCTPFLNSENEEYKDIQLNKNLNNKETTVFRETDRSNSVILFVHGFSGESSDSFGEIPNLLLKNPKLKGWDMYPLGYSAQVMPENGKEVWASVQDIDRIADYLTTSIRFKYGKYNRIAIVAYSLGGLAVQRAILNSNYEDQKRISHLLLFGSPNNGLDHKQLDKVWNKKYADLGKDASFIKTLRNDWKANFPQEYPFEFKVIAGTQDEFIPLSSNFEPFDKKHCYSISGNHLEMLKVKNKKSDAYQIISKTLSDNPFFNQYTDEAEINVALGKYDKVIKQFLPVASELDLRGFKQLVFALEGHGKYEKAMQLLNEHPLGYKNSDLLGVLGGRLKRKYLESFSSKTANKCMECYEQGLAIAQEKSNHPQIYYHAINLAFMNLVSVDDDFEMTKYAKLALIHADKDPRDSLWKMATIAEANIYLNDLTAAQNHYKAAAKMAGIREKISIYTNAYKAYTCLMLTDDSNDSFIKFLKDNFLS